MLLKKIEAPIPENYNRSQLVIKERGEEVFVGHLHRVKGADGIEGTHDSPVCLEQNGEYFEIPEAWRKHIPKVPKSRYEFVNC